MAAAPLRPERWPAVNLRAVGISTSAASSITVESIRDGKCPGAMHVASATVARKSRGPKCSTWFPKKESRTEAGSAGRASMPRNPRRGSDVKDAGHWLKKRDPHGCELPTPYFRFGYWNLQQFADRENK